MRSVLQIFTKSLNCILSALSRPLVNEIAHRDPADFRARIAFHIIVNVAWLWAGINELLKAHGDLGYRLSPYGRYVLTRTP